MVVERRVMIKTKLRRMYMDWVMKMVILRLIFFVVNGMNLWIS